MNRRNFLRLAVAAPAIPYLPALAAAPAVVPGMVTFVDPPMVAAVKAAMQSDVKVFDPQYRMEFIAAFEQRQSLLRQVVK